MAERVRYICKECGHVQTGWTGKCPNCGAWASMEESRVFDVKGSRSKRSGSERERAIPLSQVVSEPSERMDTGLEELNRVLGGGLIRDSVNMLTARPGAGKSTLLLQVSMNFALQGRDVLYASGEESTGQIKNRAGRLFKELNSHIYLLSTNSMDQVIREISRLHPALLILDSVQTFELEEFGQRQGTPTQTLRVTDQVVQVSKDPSHPMASFIVGHMTKSDEMAGLRTLEHLVDTVLYLDDGGEEGLRLLRATKNRFGYTGEVGLFQMTAEGLMEVRDPYSFFLTKRDKPVTGSAISLQKEGSRFIPVEIEALVSPSYEPYPMRIGDSLRRDQLNTLVAVLEVRAGYRLDQRNIVLKATGGIVIKERVTDLAVLIAIASAADGFPLFATDAFLAEVGLTGELKKAEDGERRIQELSRMGFQRVFVSADFSCENHGPLQVIACQDLSQVLDRIKREGKGKRTGKN